VDFSLHMYDRLCAALVAAGYTSVPMAAAMQQAASLPPKTVLLRHDVDSRPRHAAKLGAIETKHGLTASYHFRSIASLFDPHAMQAVAEQGHEVGYHYETLAQTNGDIDQAITLFAEELKKLRHHAPIHVASMHGSPLSRHDNRTIWQTTTPAAFDLIGEAYRDLDYRQWVYLNDTGRTWHPTRYNLRDHTTTPSPYTPNTTLDLIELIEQGEIKYLCISAHPERWQNGIAWHIQRGRDVVTNSIKLALKRLYALSPPNKSADR